MDSLVPWQRLFEALPPFYFPDSAGQAGPASHRPGAHAADRLPTAVVCHALADEALEDAIYDSQAMRDFIGIDLAIKNVPDATTLCLNSRRPSPASAPRWSTRFMSSRTSSATGRFAASDWPRTRHSCLLCSPSAIWCCRTGMTISSSILAFASAR